MEVHLPALHVVLPVPDPCWSVAEHERHNLLRFYLRF